MMTRLFEIIEEGTRENARLAERIKELESIKEPRVCSERIERETKRNRLDAMVAAIRTREVFHITLDMYSKDRLALENKYVAAAQRQLAAIDCAVDNDD